MDNCNNCRFSSDRGWNKLSCRNTKRPKEKGSKILQPLSLSETKCERWEQGSQSTKVIKSTL